MATIIHCVKTKESTMFRLWNTNGDYYATPPLTREQMLEAAVFYFAAVAVDRVLWQEVDSTERALQLAELQGTSGQSPRRRKVTWDPEISPSEDPADLLLTVPGLRIEGDKIVIGTLQPLSVDQATVVAAKIVQQAALLKAMIDRREKT